MFARLRSLNDGSRRAVRDREREWKIGTVGAQVQNWRTITCGHARITEAVAAAAHGRRWCRLRTRRGKRWKRREGERVRVRSWWHQLPASRDTLRSHRSRTSLVFASCQARLVSRFFEKRSSRIWIIASTEYFVNYWNWTRGWEVMVNTEFWEVGGSSNKLEETSNLILFIVSWGNRLLGMAVCRSRFIDCSFQWDSLGSWFSLKNWSECVIRGVTN